MTDSIEKFSGRAVEYDKFRPSYPVEMLDFFKTTLGMTTEHLLVDIGAGTGKLTEILLKNGNSVYAVEPNDEMRRLASTHFSDNPAFVAVKGTAEKTNLPEQAADFIFAAQSFHWFDAAEARKEFMRILRGKRMVILIWNIRISTGSDFLDGYERALCEYAPDYAQHGQDYIDTKAISSIYGGHHYKTMRFSNSQVLSEVGLIGRVLSNSYVPSPSDHCFQALLAAMRKLFHECKESGIVRIEYHTEVIYGYV
ncbi:class I SAM-dependent methyltransferase [candidate division KSB1 bacterium]